MDDLIRTRVLTHMVARMQRTHDRRRASFFVGPPGIGKSTAALAFARANAPYAIYRKVPKRNASGLQVLQELLQAVREHNGKASMTSMHAIGDVVRNIAKEVQLAAHGIAPDAEPGDFPKLTIVFDEAQRLTNAAIDALRDYNEPHGQCRAMFPIGLIFIGNNELSLEATQSGASILDEGMTDRLLYRERLTYEDVERSDLDRFVRALGVGDDGAVSSTIAAFAGPRAQRSFRRIADFVDELRDEAGDDPVTRETVRTVLALS